MVLGNPGQKIGTIIELAEELYEKVTEVREQIDAMRETVSDTNERVERLERELEEQRALLSAVASERGIDVDAVTEDAEATAEE